MKAKDFAEILLEIDRLRPGIEIVFSDYGRDKEYMELEMYGKRYITDPDYYTRPLSGDICFEVNRIREGN